jgi:Holliday junction resolvase RusA-like endonuclease
MTDDPFRLTLPELPPPLSACFKNAKGRGRVKTARYRAWIGNATACIGALPHPMFDCPIQVTYTLVRPDKRTRDLDNLLKALNDLLVSTNVIEDDSLIWDLRIRWAIHEQPLPVTVAIEEIVPTVGPR